MHLWHTIVTAFLAVLMTGSISTCFMTPEERQAHEALEGLLSMAEPAPLEDPNAVYWFDNVGEITDEPAWELNQVDPVRIRISDISEIDIPNPDDWTCFYKNIIPIYLSKEGSNLVLRGLHQIKIPILSEMSNTGVIDGAQRWVIGQEHCDEFKFDLEGKGIRIVAGVNVPDRPGLEFLVQVEMLPDSTDESGQINPYADLGLMLFDQIGQYIASVDLTDVEYWSIANGFPLEYNDTSRILLDCMRQDEHYIYGADGEEIEVRDYYMLDLTGDTGVYLDPRSGNPDAPLHPSAWLSSTGEFIDIGERYETGAYALSVISEDLSTATTHPKEWPDFPDANFFFGGMVRPFIFNGDRYFLFYGDYSGAYSHPEAPMIFWCVKYNEGDSEIVPVWCRYIEGTSNLSYEVLYMGDEARPYLVQFSNITEKLLVTDLPSGQLMIDRKLDLTNFNETDTRPYHVIRLDQYNDIPVVVIFDKEAGHIVKIDLELIEL